MRRHKGALAASVLLIIAIVATGCRTMRPIDLNSSNVPKAFAGIEIGDLVAVELRDGSKHRFEVRGIEGEALVSDVGRRYPCSEMVKLQHESVHAGKTIGLVGSIVAGYAVLQTMVAKGYFGR